MRNFNNPAPMTIDQALAAENPTFEISLRLGRSEKQPMSAAEKLFYEASCVLGDVLNGGFDQCLFNSSGDYFSSAVIFAEAHCDPRVAAVLRQVVKQFPDDSVPEDRIERQDILESITSDKEELFDPLDRKFYQLEKLYIDGLLNLARCKRAEFVNLDWEAEDA